MLKFEQQKDFFKAYFKEEAELADLKKAVEEVSSESAKEALKLAIERKEKSLEEAKFHYEEETKKVDEEKTRLLSPRDLVDEKALKEAVKKVKIEEPVKEAKIEKPIEEPKKEEKAPVEAKKGSIYRIKEGK